MRALAARREPLRDPPRENKANDECGSTSESSPLVRKSLPASFSDQFEISTPLVYCVLWFPRPIPDPQKRDHCSLFAMFQETNVIRDVLLLGTRPSHRCAGVYARGLFFCSPLTIPSLIANSIMDSGRSVGGRADSSGTLRTTSSSSEVRDGAVDDIGGKSDNVKVCIRVRPLLGGESRSAWTHDDKSLVRACTQLSVRAGQGSPSRS